MDETPRGMVKDLRLEQLENALLPIKVTESGIEIEESFLQEENA